MAGADFRFVEAYRRLAPAASRDIIETREKQHEELLLLLPDSMERVYDACRLAFQLPSNSGGWFEDTVRESDSQCSIEHDGVEAGRIASLVLRDLMSRNNPHAALAVLVCFCSGRRTPVDAQLPIAARDAVSTAARARRILSTGDDLATVPSEELTAALDAVNTSWSAETTRAAIAAVLSESRNTSTNEAQQLLSKGLVRLAEETDMLWWHVGDWSESLNRARTGLPDDAVGLVSGVELGDFVRDVPGPYGAYGILRRTLAQMADRQGHLKDVIHSIGADVKHLVRPLPEAAVILRSEWPVGISCTTDLAHGIVLLRYPRNTGKSLDVWLDALEAADDDVSGDDRARLQAFLLREALQAKASASWRVVATVLPELRGKILTDALPRDVFQMLVNELPQFDSVQYWDLNKRILLALSQVLKSTRDEQGLQAVDLPLADRQTVVHGVEDEDTRSKNRFWWF